jgi:hypothetical protein
MNVQKHWRLPVDRLRLVVLLFCACSNLSVLAQGVAPPGVSATAPGDPAGRAGPVVERDELFEPSQILATVGDQYILAADVIPHVNQVLAPHRDKMPADVLAQQRRALIAQITRSHIETKLLYLAFLRKIPADKVAEIHGRVETTFAEELDELRKKAEQLDRSQQGELMKNDPQMGRMVLLMKERNVWTQRELDILLREYGGSITQEKAFYIEYKLGRAVVSQNIKFNPEITLDDMLRYYGEKESDYAFPDRARFEVITVKKENFSTPQEAYQALAGWGNEVYYGANFGAVAKRSSQGLNASQGGLHGWTPRGSLVSRTLEDAVFALELGKLSPILEDERQLYIVRVLERQQAGRVPFEQVQDEIREKLRRAKITQQYDEFVAKAREGITVTTAFDSDPQLRVVARPDETPLR